MTTRPTSVTAIAWLVIIINVLSLVGSAMTLNDPATRELMAQSPVPIAIQHALVFAGVGTSLVCGIVMLRAANWARLLYIGWNGLYLLFLFFTSPAKAMLVPAVLVYAIVVFFLLRPKAVAYFTRPENDRNG